MRNAIGGARVFGPCCLRFYIAVAMGIFLSSCAENEISRTETEDFLGRLLSPAPIAGEPESSRAGDRDAPLVVQSTTRQSDASYIVPSVSSANGGVLPPNSLAGGDEDTFSFRFVDTDVADLIDAVLGEALKVSYAIDPSVTARVSISTNAPMDKEAVLATLADVLSIHGIAVVQLGDVYRIQNSSTPISSAMQRLGSEFETMTRIVPLRYVAGTEIVHIVGSIEDSNVLIRAVGDRNIVTVTGARQDVASVLELIETFDTSALDGMSFGLFFLDFASASAVVGELRQIFNIDGSGHAAVRLMPIDRLNGFFAFAPDAQMLREIQTWTQRLDQVVSSASTRIFVRPVKHRRSSELAEILNQLYRGDGSSLTADVRQADGQAVRISERSKIVDDEANNAVLFYGTAAEYGVVRDTLDLLDVPPHQVLIEAAVVEVSLNDDLRYGVQWLFESGDFKSQLSNATSGAIAGTFPGFALSVEASNINAVLNALDSVTKINVVSSPRMLVESGKTATLQVGDQVPIATQTSTSTTSPDAPTVNTIQFRDTGVILEVTPQVNDGGFVKLHVRQEVSDVTATTTSDLDSPTIQQRLFESYISVEDGTTIALGGLIRDRSETSRSGVPLASDIPILGNLFSTTSDAFDRSELLVLITPRVVQTSDEVRELTDELKAGLQNTLTRGGY